MLSLVGWMIAHRAKRGYEMFRVHWFNQIRRVGGGGFRFQHWIVKPRDDDDLYIRPFIPRDHCELKTVECAESHVRHQYIERLRK